MPVKIVIASIAFASALVSGGVAASSSWCGSTCSKADAPVEASAVATQQQENWVTPCSKK